MGRRCYALSWDGLPASSCARPMAPHLCRMAHAMNLFRVGANTAVLAENNSNPLNDSHYVVRPASPKSACPATKTLCVTQAFIKLKQEGARHGQESVSQSSRPRRPEKKLKQFQFNFTVVRTYCHPSHNQSCLTGVVDRHPRRDNLFMP